MAEGPTKIRLEACSMCQLKCPSCATGIGYFRNTIIGWGHLRFADFKSLVDGNPSIRHIELSNNGEIFLNAELEDIIGYAFQKGITLTAGNGVNFNSVSDRMLDCLTRCRFSSLTISIDGASEETYSAYRRGGSLERVLANIRKLNERKRLHCSRLPHLTWQFIVFGHNEHEIGRAREMAASLGMGFATKLNHDQGYSPVRDRSAVGRETGSQVTSLGEFREKTRQEYYGFCYQLWREPQVNWDGKLLGCCANSYGDFGNVFTDGLGACLESERYLYAKRMLLGEAPTREDIPCVECPAYAAIRAARGGGSGSSSASGPAPRAAQKPSVALAICPSWAVEQFPLGIASLKAYLQERGIPVKCFDFSADLYSRAGPEMRERFMLHTAQEWIDSFEETRKLLGIDSHVERWARLLAEHGAQVVGFSVYGPTERTTLLVARRLKQLRPDTKIVFGGHMCTPDTGLWRHIQSGFVDAVISGEGEEALLDYVLNGESSVQGIAGVVMRRGGSVIDGQDRPLLKDLDALPFPDFSDFDAAQYSQPLSIPLVTSRGCISRCTFCQEQRFWGHFRFRSAESVMREIEEQIARHANPHFDLVDSLINGNMKQLERLCDMLIEKKLDIIWGGKARIDRSMTRPFLEKMRRAGCRYLHYGMESASADVQKDMRKGVDLAIASRVLEDTHEAGISCRTFWIVGYPTEKEADFQRSLDFLTRNARLIDDIIAAPCGVMEGTALFERSAAYGLVFEQGGWRLGDSTNTPQVRQERLRRMEEHWRTVKALAEGRMGSPAPRQEQHCQPPQTGTRKEERERIIFLGGESNLNPKYRLPGDWKAGETLLEDVLSEIRHAARSSCTALLLRGGEPTLRKDIADILAAARDIPRDNRGERRGFERLVLETTCRAFCYPDLARAMREAGLTDAVVKLWAPEAQLFDSLARTPGSFGQVRTGMRNLIGAGVRVRAVVPVVEENADALAETVAMAKECGAGEATLVPIGEGPAQRAKAAFPPIEKRFSAEGFTVRLEMPASHEQPQQQQPAGAGGLQAVPQRLGPREAGILSGKPLLGPKTIQLEPTNTCDLDCVFCGYHAPPMRKHAEYRRWCAERLSLETMKGLIDQAAEMKTEEIILGGGGEPFLHPDIMEVIRHIKEKGMSLVVFTNGATLTRERIAEIIRLGVDCLKINISCGSAADLRAIRTMPSEGRFEGYKRRLALVSELKREMGRQNPQVIAYYVLTTLNKDYDGMMALAEDIGADEVWFCPAYYSYPGCEHLLITTGEAALLEGALGRYRAERGGGGLRVNNKVEAHRGGIPERAEGKHQFSLPAVKDMMCAIGWQFSRVLSNGRVDVCCSCPVAMGSLHASSFRDIWHSEKYAAFRGYARERFRSRQPLYPCCDNCCHLGMLGPLWERLRGCGI